MFFKRITLCVLIFAAFFAFWIPPEAKAYPATTYISGKVTRQSAWSQWRSEPWADKGVVIYWLSATNYGDCVGQTLQTDANGDFFAECHWRTEDNPQYLYVVPLNAAGYSFTPADIYLVPVSGATFYNNNFHGVPN
jgi:hypothetical protein